MLLDDFGRHQVHQWEDEHPHQVNEVPVQSRYLDIVRVIILGLQEENRGRDNCGDQENMNSNVEYIAGRRNQPTNQPKTEQDGQEFLA